MTWPGPRTQLLIKLIKQFVYDQLKDLISQKLFHDFSFKVPFEKTFNRHIVRRYFIRSCMDRDYTVVGDLSFYRRAGVIEDHDDPPLVVVRLLLVAHVPSQAGPGREGCAVQYTTNVYVLGTELLHIIFFSAMCQRPRPCWA